MATFTTNAALDQDEIKLLQTVITSINIGVPADDTLNDKERRDDEAWKLRRALNALASGDSCGQELYERALAALAMQIEACERESQIDHWLDQLTDEQRAISMEVATGPTRMADVIAEARRCQLSDALQAHDMLHDALIAIMMHNCTALA